MGLEFNKRRVKRTQEDQAMNPIVGTHTKEDMSAAKEGKQEDTMCKETNCYSLSPLSWYLSSFFLTPYSFALRYVFL